jgi:hypothetical protein
MVFHFSILKEVTSAHASFHELVQVNMCVRLWDAMHT